MCATVVKEKSQIISIDIPQSLGYAGNKEIAVNVLCYFSIPTKGI